MWSGIRLAIAASFAPIHARNNINLGLLMGDHAILARLAAGRGHPARRVHAGPRPDQPADDREGGLFPFCGPARGQGRRSRARDTPRGPMNITEKILARATSRARARYVKPGDAVLVSVDAGYSHEFTTAQVDYFLAAGVRRGLQLANPAKFAVFEDHLIYATGVPRWRSSPTRSRRCAGCSARSSRRPACATTARWTASRPASATRSRASSSSSRATSSRRPTATPAWAAHQRARLGRRRDRVRRAPPLGLHVHRGARVDPVRADGPARARASPRRT